MASKVEICGVNTSKLPRYRDREMQEMLEAIKAGDERMGMNLSAGISGLFLV